MTQHPEFSRRIPLNRIGNGIEETVEATPQEREALARRFSIVSVDSLTCRFRVTPVTDTIFLAEGWLGASVHQVCAISHDVFADALTEAFSVRFVPRDELPEDEFDVDSIDLDALDDVPHDGRGLDLGETAAEQLALMLDPYPRKPGVQGLDDAVDVAPPEQPSADGFRRAAPSSAAGGMPDRESAKPNPFAVLAALRGGKKDD